MSILETIASYKLKEVAQNMELFPISLLERSPLFHRKPASLTERLRRPEASGIIAEFKRKSPSKGIINDRAKVTETTTGYRKAGASGLSVLTDHSFFGGTNEDLTNAREVNECPILRKDFILDPYQVVEAKSIGADVVLLIAAILTPKETLTLATLARSLGMETILEVHGLEEFKYLNDQISILGVNNRNLADFTVSLDISLSVSEFIPGGMLAISESGIHEPSDVHLLRQAGYQGFLIGELFMSAENPDTACQNFITRIKQIN